MKRRRRPRFGEGTDGTRDAAQRVRGKTGMRRLRFSASGGIQSAPRLEKTVGAAVAFN
jgi:hypothetical protein